MKRMADRGRPSVEDIVRKLRRAYELSAEGMAGEEIDGELGVSAATLYNWRRGYGGLDTDATRNSRELREQNARLKRLLADAEVEKDARGRWSLESSEPSYQAPRRGHAQRGTELVGEVGVQGRRAGPAPPAVVCHWL